MKDGAKENPQGRGFVGLLTSNSFMKREFGKNLVTEFFPGVDLTHVIDTAGCFIPGHGTPTVILLGRGGPPDRETVKLVSGLKGEPETPKDPALGKVWQSILSALYGEGRDADVFDRIPEWAGRRCAGDQIGDLYQQTDVEARKGRALVQTPPFVRVLLLRETLGRSMAGFGLADTRFCDPACGTGHLLVDAFRVLYRAFAADRPGVDRREVAQDALDRVAGADVDPVCTELANYRLIQAAWDETGWPNVTYHTNVYTGDSLTHHRPEHGDVLDDEMAEAMQPGRYTAVAANPPYVAANPKDAKKYRGRYGSAHRRFSLGCPFTELCWGLAKPPDRPPLPDVGNSVPTYPGQNLLFSC